MRLFVGIAGVVLFVAILWDAFETVILPRRVMRSFRMARVFFRSIWWIWLRIALTISSTKNANRI